jgi:hypothetical protein
VGQQGSASASRLLGLEGFEAIAAEIVGGEWQLDVQTVATVVGCVGCGVRATPHGRRTVRVRDLPIGGRPVLLWWRKRLWRCREPACGVRTWTEQAAAISPRAVPTERARAEACRRVGKDAHAVAAVARDLGVGWATVMRAVADHGSPLVDDAARLEGVVALGLDETSFLKRPAWRRPDGSPGWWTWRVAGCWTWWPTAPGHGGRLAWCSARCLAGPGRHGRPRPLARVCQCPDGSTRPRHRGRGPLPRRPAGQHGGRPDSAPRPAGHPRSPGPQAGSPVPHP